MAVVLMLVGIGLIGVLTATVASVFIKEHTDANKEEFKKGHADLGQQLAVISDRLADVERRLGATPAEVAAVDARRTPRPRRTGRSSQITEHPPPERENIARMKGTLTQDGTATDATQQGIEQAAAGGAFFWLDLDVHDPGPDDDVTGLLINTFHFHPVAVEAADQFGQRARIDDYDDFVHVITFGMAGDGKNVAEVHCFITEKFIISIHQGDCPALATVRDRIGTHHSSDVGRPAGRRLLPDHGHPDRLVLPRALRLRRCDRRPRGRHPEEPDRGAAGDALRHEAADHDHPQGRSRPSAT